MVMPRAFSSGALSISSNGVNWTLGFLAARVLVIAAVSVVLPWSMWPIVPTLMWGLVRSNFCLAIRCGSVSPNGARRRRPYPVSLPPHPGDDLPRDGLGHLLVRAELHAVGGTPLG